MTLLPEYLQLKGPLQIRKKPNNPNILNLYKWYDENSHLPLFQYYDVFLVGSMLQDIDYPNDIDIIVQGSNKYPNYIYLDLVEAAKIGMIDYGLPLDILYCPDISFFNLEVIKENQREFKAYSFYDFDYIWASGQCVRTRNFSNNPKWGLLTEHKFPQPSDKGIERGYPKFNYQKLNLLK